MNELEDKYLKAKIAYYEGSPIMSDTEFDTLEEELRKSGSDIINQVGSKRRNFDFPHPSRMRSLAKIQTERKDLFVDYKYEEFIKWYKKRADAVGNHKLIVSPKFDGNAINIIYNKDGLVNILTRGDGKSGKSIMDKLQNFVPNKLILSQIELSDSDIIEIRCEAVMDLIKFREKYSDTFANARNYVAGLLGKDDLDLERLSELKIIPLYFLINGKQVDSSIFANNKVFHSNYSIIYEHTDYVNAIKLHENIRKELNIQLDGVVFNFPVSVREQLGENDHDPEWAIAIKFIPEDAEATVSGIEWNVSKSGELIPTVLIDPIFLDGSKVSRASGYNAGYVLTKEIGKGAKVGLAKSGDIIPEIQRVIEKKPFSEESFPKKCIACGSKTSFDGIHLMCQNSQCVGKISKQLSYALKILDIKRVGEKTIEPFAREFKNIYEVIKWVRTVGDLPSGKIERFGIKYGSRSHHIFLDAFENIKKVSYARVIQMLGYENVGEKIAYQISREYNGLEPNYSNLDKSVVALLRSDETRNFIMEVVKGLRNLGIEVESPKTEKKESSNSTYACLTGSPKNFGYKTKEDFLSKFPNIIEVSISDKNCKLLVTDSLQSSSSKMKTAGKKGIKIITYGDL